jgi:hypothetical protein
MRQPFAIAGTLETRAEPTRGGLPARTQLLTLLLSNP